MPQTEIKSRSELRLGFFELLFGLNEGFLCIFTTDPRAPKTGVKQRFFQWPRESLKVEDYVEKVEGKLNVYFCINLLTKQERVKANCQPTDLLWADLDNVNPETITNVPPSVIVQSSPGRWQAFWRVTSKLDPYDAERYSRRIAYSVGADTSGWDLTQLFRVPLTTNFKYKPPVPVALDRAVNTRAKPELFELAFRAPPEEVPILDTPTETVEAEEIIAKYQSRLDYDRFITLYTHEPEEDWSKALWALEVMCLRAGMTAEEVFVICRESACNKYKRDHRPVSDLWREVLKANEQFGNLPPEKELLQMPKLVNEPASETFIDIYKDWACEATDAIGEFHELSAFMVLSALTAGSVRLATSYGMITPNLWGLILGDSTVTRKSTSMKMAVDLLTSMEAELMLATDGSVEGLLSGLATRPNKVSVFFRDEVSGLFDSINKRDYLSSMPETLAHLYDVPPVYSRLLRKEVIRIESPAFIFFGGGITERVYQTVSEDWIESGFIPRFMIVSGEFDKEVMRPTGPPTKIGEKKKAAIVIQLADLYENYANEVPTKIAGQEVFLPPRVMAHMTDDAWARYQSIENEMAVLGYESIIRNTALPTFDRMSRSIMKMSMILAASRQIPIDNAIMVEESDVINAAWYAQKWGRHSVNLIISAGKNPREKYMDKVYNKIADNPGILKSTIMQHLHLSKRDMDEVIDNLKERMQVREEKIGNGRRYFVT